MGEKLLGCRQCPFRFYLGVLFFFKRVCRMHFFAYAISVKNLSAALQRDRASKEAGAPERSALPLSEANSER